MPDIDADGCMIHAEVEGPERAPVLMLSNSLGTNLHMWDEQVAPFTRHFRLLRYDRRGHGKSGVPKAPYSMERLGRDVLAVLDGLGIEKINWCGLSMGGMVGQWLGANAPNRVDKLILSNTGPDVLGRAPEIRARQRASGTRRRHARDHVECALAKILSKPPFHVGDWRIMFRFEDGKAFDLDLVDYH
jgi:pimeloyl-ACP methyl ester carboxylesterase